MIWGVFLAVLAALALLGRTRLGILAEYTAQRQELWLRIGGGKWRLYPPKRKRERPGKRERTPRPSGKRGKGEERAPILSPRGMFELARRLLPVALEGADNLRRCLQVDLLRLEILAGAEDPADAAAWYGRIYGLLGAVWQPLVQALRIQDGRVHVALDFHRTSPALYGRLALSLTAAQLLRLGLQYGPRCLNLFLDVRKQDRRVSAQKRKAA